MECIRHCQALREPQGIECITECKRSRTAWRVNIYVHVTLVHWIHQTPNVQCVEMDTYDSALMEAGVFRQMTRPRNAIHDERRDEQKERTCTTCTGRDGLVTQQLGACQKALDGMNEDYISIRCL